MKLDPNSYNGWPAIDPGQLRHKITFLTQVVAPDDSGQGISWQVGSPPFQKWARIEPLSGRETIKDGQTIGQVIAAVMIRYDADVVETMRFLSPNGATWVIEEIQNVMEMNTWMVMTCSQLGPDKA